MHKHKRQNHQYAFVQKFFFSSLQQNITIIAIYTYNSWSYLRLHRRTFLQIVCAMDCCVFWSYEKWNDYSMHAALMLVSRFRINTFILNYSIYVIGWIQFAFDIRCLILRQRIGRLRMKQRQRHSVLLFITPPNQSRPISNANVHAFANCTKRQYCQMFDNCSTESIGNQFMGNEISLIRYSIVNFNCISFESMPFG